MASKRPPIYNVWHCGKKIPCLSVKKTLNVGDSVLKALNVGDSVLKALNVGDSVLKALNLMYRVFSASLNISCTTIGH